MGILYGLIFSLGYAFVSILFGYFNLFFVLINLPLLGSPVIQGLFSIVILAPIMGVLSGLRYDGLAIIKHYTIRLILWKTGVFAGNMRDFLDYCVDRIFLRRVGGGYIFVHRLLQEHFASLTPEDIERLAKGV